MLKRSLQTQIQKDLDKKIVILSGPRQCGKTTLSKELYPKSFEYLNFDSMEDRSQILKKQWDRSKSILILDELHKMKKWKFWLKGIYDTQGLKQKILVTGSAQLDTFKKTGDSLAGRHFSFRLHPFDLKELKAQNIKLSDAEIFDRLLTVGGFPEPFLDGTKNFHNRWRKTYTDIVLRQDMVDLDIARDIQTIEMLMELLRDRVGSTITYAGLAQQLDRDPKTIQRWLMALENLHIVFRLNTYHKNIARAVKKEPKYYFYDTGLVRGDEAARFENVIACALLKEVHYLQDVEGENASLWYLRAKGGKEIDFLVKLENRSWLIEAKLGESEPSKNFSSFASHFSKPEKIQLVKNLDREFSTPEGIQVKKAMPWLSNFSFLEKKNREKLVI